MLYKNTKLTTTKVCTCNKILGAMTTKGAFPSYW